MSDFVEVKLKEIFPFSIPGEWGADPTSDEVNAKVLRAADFTKDCKLVEAAGVPRRIPQSKLAKVTLKSGDLLVEKSGGSPDQPVGRVAFFNKDTSELYAFSNFLQVLRASPEYDPEFAYYLMAYLYNTGVAGRYHQQTTGIINFKLDQYLKERVRVPRRLRAQEKLRSILSSIDLAITKTEALIEKYQKVKAGLIQDLFTRGIGEDSKLRPARSEAPDLYKQTPFGWLPKEWDYARCGDICQRISVGIVIRPADYYVIEGIPAFRSANVRESGLDPSNLVYISAFSNKLLAKSQLLCGDILTVRTGYPGTSCVVPAQFGGCNCVDILISTPTSRVGSNFLCYWINSSFGKEQVLRHQGGLAQQHFNVGELRDLITVLPSQKEQQEIVTRLSACDDRLSSEEHFLEKLKQKKSGLMHDLLTGKVEVKFKELKAAHV